MRIMREMNGRMLTILRGDFGETLSNLGVVVVNVLLKLFRKIGIAFQLQTKGK